MSSEIGTRQRKILVVDDDPVARMLASHALSGMGFACDEATDGREALARIEAEIPDLVLLDLDMPGLNGFDTCEALRASEATRELPVLVVTGFTDSETIDRAYQVGATDFMKKPVDFAVLRHHVRFVIRAYDAFHELRSTLSELKESDRRLEGAQKLAHLGHWEWTPEADEMLWSTETFRIFGREPHAEQPSLGAFLQAVHPDDRASVEKLLQPSGVEHQSWSLGHRVLTDQGEIRVVQQHATVSTNPDGVCISGTIQDVTERRRAEEQIDFLAHFDSLTALPNRKLLCERLDRLVDRSRHDGQLLGVIRLDLDRFGRVNDTLGQDVGDELLRAVARRLQSCVRPADVVAQSDDDAAVSSLGGDEFSIVLTNVHTAQDLSHIAKRILDSLRLPLSAKGHEIEMTASLGIAMFPGDATDRETLLRNAGTAMSQAKEHGGASFRFFDPSMNEMAIRHMQIETGLRSAVEQGELRLVYQPQWDSKTRRLTGMEALLRWHSAQLGDVSPGEFIPVAEKANLINRIGEWVFEQSCRQLKDWQSRGIDPVPVAVNFSSRQLHTTEVASQVTRVMRSFGIDPGLIELEMTESAFVGDSDEVLEVLSSLKATGVRVALDDFGTGYSSISHLARFPIDVLKIDQSFVSKIGDKQGSALVSALIAMARRLSLTVVAEGVETEVQADFLRDEGCDVLQGFVLSRPLEVEVATQLLADRE